MNRKTPYAFLHLLFAVSFVLLLNSCIQTSYTYGVIGNPAISANGQYITVLVAESKGTSRQVNGGYRSTDYTGDYWLKQYKTTTGKLVDKKKIVSTAEQMNMQVICYGGDGDKIWLHTDGLKAYNITSLKEEVNEEKLVKQNNFDRDDFPIEQRSFDVMLADGYIRFTAINGNKYLLNINSLKITGDKEIAGKTRKQQHLLIPGNMSYAVRSDTVGSKMYILAKDSATAMSSHPGDSNDQPVYRPLYLFTSSYTINKTGSHSFFRNSNLRKLPGAAYLNGTLLKDFSTDKVLHLQQPGAYIILHSDSLGNNARALLTAIDKNNNSIWQLNTGLSSKPTNCIINNKYCILTGNKHYLLTPRTGSDMICVVDINTGKIVTPSLKE